MTNKEVHKIVVKQFNLFFKEYGFIKRGTNCWVRSTDEMIHMICLNFSYGQEHFDFDIAVQPWCVPEEDIYLNISARLKMLDNRDEVRSWGSCDAAVLDNDIKDAEQVFVNCVFPLLEQLSDCMSLIKTVDRITGEKIFVIDPYKKSRLWTYINYYKHNFIEADECARQYSVLHNDFNSEKTIEDKAKIKSLGKFFSNNDIEEIDKFFADIIESNRRNFKLDKTDKRS